MDTHNIVIIIIMFYFSEICVTFIRVASYNYRIKLLLMYKLVFKLLIFIAFLHLNILCEVFA